MNADTEAGGEARRGGGAAAKTHKTGLLIIRAWVEEGSSEPLRAIVRSTTDIAAGIEHTLTLACAEEVGATVQKWLGEFLGQRDPA